MKTLGILVSAATVWGIISMPALAEDLVIIGPSGNFLGLVGSDGDLCSEYDSDCIWNTYSSYGSEYSESSIFNDYSEYGSDYGRNSVCNHRISYEEMPSLFLMDGNYVAFYDVIGPDSSTQIGHNLYISACLR